MRVEMITQSFLMRQSYFCFDQLPSEVDSLVVVVEHLVTEPLCVQLITFKKERQPNSSITGQGFKISITTLCALLFFPPLFPMIISLYFTVFVSLSSTLN